ncbi:hypothetical protein VKS41_004602 [Umbelopsis sp. WA50703]
MGQSEKKKSKKEKKEKKAVEEVVEEKEAKPKKQKEKKDKKIKKDKKSSKEKDTKDKKSKKEKKEKKRKRESESDVDVDAANEPVDSKPAKKVAQEAPPAAATEETASGRWNDWTKASFGGDDAQKNKFLRLLGAKKSGNETSGSGSNYSNQSSAIDDNVNQKMSKELEKQFQDGLKMRKQSYGGKRGGLGWS